MRRRVFNLLAAVSLLLFVATVIMWVRSYPTTAGGETFSAVGPIGIEVQSLRGGLLIEASRGWPGNLILRHGGPFERARRWAVAGWSVMKTAVIRPIALGSVRVGRGRADVAVPDVYGSERQMTYYWVQLPHWLAAMLLAIMPAIFLIRWLRQRRSARRAAAGLCAACGYDLRATPHQCPECGAVAGISEPKPLIET
jgi:hypothetical protein